MDEKTTSSHKLNLADLLNNKRNKKLAAAMSPDPDKHGIFRDHRCWKCKDGEYPCVNGSPRQCDYPRARND